MPDLNYIQIDVPLQPSQTITTSSTGTSASWFIKTADGTDAITPIDAEVDDSTKAGARHSQNDMSDLARLDQLTDEIKTLIRKLGYERPAESGGDSETNPNSVIEPGSEVVSKTEASAGDEEQKAVSLDERVDAVRSAFYRQFRNDSAYGTEEYPYCIAVYDAYIVVKCGINHYKISYTVGGDKIEFAAKEQWQKVESEWVAKNITLDVFPEEVYCVKALGGDRLGMHLVVWGNPEQRDLYKEYFTSKTEDLTTIFKAVGKIPLLYHHAMDSTVKTDVVGLIDVMQADDVGLWVEAQLDAANKYKEGIKRLARQQALGSSSGTLPGARKVSKDGEILRWAIVEGSLTPSPAEPRQRTDLPVTVLKGYYEEAGLTLPETAHEEPAGAEDAQKAADELDLARELLDLYRLELSL